MDRFKTFLNQVHNRISDVVSERGDPPWSERLVETGEVMANLICRGPGDSSRRHYHKDHDEFWVVMGGELVWYIEGMEPLHARTGDIVMVPKGKAHHIVTVGNGPSLRLAIVIPDVPHIDVETGKVWT